MPPDLTELFTSGTLLRPSDTEPNLVHLIRALATIAGVRDLDAAPAVRDLGNLIGPARHLIFMLMDGMGMNLLERLPASSFLASSVQREIRATCPSTTACALTTVATAAYPNQHGVSGWVTHLPDRRLTIATLPFVERFSGEPLARRGIRGGDVGPLPPVLPRVTYGTLVLSP